MDTDNAAAGHFVSRAPEVSLGSTGSAALEGSDLELALSNIATTLGVPGAHLGATGLIVPATVTDLGSVGLWVTGGAMAVIRANDGSNLDLSGQLQLRLVAPIDDDEANANANAPTVRARLDGKLVTLTPLTGGVSLQTAFPNVVIRMDGSETTDYHDTGSGSVNCQFGAGPWEKFQLVSPGDGSVAFESIAFPHVFLRLDGSSVTGYADNGAGTVNCQYGDSPGPWEKFTIEAVENGRLAFRSLAFPDLHLRVDGSSTTENTADGSGYVNAQFGEASLWESFVIGA